MDYSHKLVFVNKVGFDFKGRLKLEFLFAEDTDIEDDSWGDLGEAYAPDPDKIDTIGYLSTDKSNFDFAQECQFFTMQDAQEGVIALAWEVIDEDNINKRLVFNYGDTALEVENKLKTRNYKFILE